MKTLISILMLLAVSCAAQSPIQFFQNEMAAASIPKVTTIDYVTNGLVAWWKFADAGSGTATDSISTNNGVLESAPAATNDHKGVANQAYNFNGNGNRIKFSATALGLGNTMSISMWIYPRTMRDNTSLFARTGPLRNEGIFDWIYGYMADAHLIAAETAGAWKTESSATGITVGNWYMVTYTVSTGGGLTYYVNGASKGTATSFDLGAAGNSAFAATFYASGGNLYDFHGAMCNVRIYNKELSQADITAIYNLEKP